MKLKISIIPNAFNESACVFIVYKVVYGFSFELGRVLSEDQLDMFLETYKRLDGGEYDA